jgi:hypothetical protein
MKNPWTSRWTEKANGSGKMPLQKKIELTSWIVFALFLCLSGVLASANFTLGILAGGVISILNFYGLCQGLRAAFAQIGSGNAGKATMILKYLLRLTVTGLVLYIVLAKTRADIFGLVIGLAVVVVGIIFSVILTFFDKSYLEEV